MYDWLLNLLGIPAQYANSNVVYGVVGFFFLLGTALMVMLVMIFDRLLNGGRRG